jgi:hypothetical protein
VKNAAPIAITVLIAIGIAIAPAFLSPRFERPPPDVALDIIEAAAGYNLLATNSEIGGSPVSSMPDAAKSAHINFVETKSCGEVDASRNCTILDVHLGMGEGRLLELSWHDATVRLESYQRSPERPGPKVIDIRRLQSSHAGELARVQVAASKKNLDFIVPSGLAKEDVLQRITLRSDTPNHHRYIYSAPWLAGDIALVEVGWICGDLCGRGETYALRKSGGSWHVIAVQSSWVS